MRLVIDGVAFAIIIGNPKAADPDWYEGKRPRVFLMSDSGNPCPGDCDVCNARQCTERRSPFYLED